MPKKELAGKLAKKALSEADPKKLSELMEDEINVRLAGIMGILGAKKEGVGPIEFSINFGRACYDMGREELKKELALGSKKPEE